MEANDEAFSEKMANFRNGEISSRLYLLGQATEV